MLNRLYLWKKFCVNM